MTSLRRLAAATPRDRERYADFLRAFSILVVVVGHWTMAVIFWRDGDIGGFNALEVVDGMWPLTWVLQVMPLFFFVGGFSNLKSYSALRRDGGNYISFVRGRVKRLMAPTIVFILFWSLLAPAIHVFLDVPVDALRAATQLVGVPLWFLAVYLVVVALAPLVVRAHERYGVLVPAGLALATAVNDVARLAFDVPVVGALNFAFVWLFAHQLGFFYADGSLTRAPRRVPVTLAAGGLVALVVLTNIGVYSPSMVGVTDGMVSNNAPPSICLVALTAWLTGAAMLLRAPASRWLQRSGPWTGTIGVNSMIMTAFLWHLTAMVAAVLVLYPLGWPQPEAGTLEWALLRPAWILALTLFLIPFVVVFGRFERTGSLPKVEVRGTPLRVAAAGLAVGALVVGMQGYVMGGFWGTAPGTNLVGLPMSPLLNAVWLGAGGLLLHLSSRPLH